MISDPSLPALPPQPENCPWPDRVWPTDDAPGQQLSALYREVFSAAASYGAIGLTQALLVVHRGRLVAEQYGDGLDAATPLPSWSVAKSVLHAVTGLMVRDSLVDIDDCLVHPAWSAPDDPRRRITIRHALQMRTGLAWREDYVDDGESNVVTMLYGSGRRDVAHYAASRPLDHDPGTRYYYSSGTSNLLSAHLGSVLRDHGLAVDDYLRDQLFAPIGITSAVPKFDAAGTWIASTFCFATARDFARFGLLYLRGGRWREHRVLPEHWVDGARTPQPDVLDDGWGYAMGWWTLPQLPGAFFANGYQGQYILLVPQIDLVVVRLGVSPPTGTVANVSLLRKVVECFDADRVQGARRE